jgi:hypothetical protein
MMSRSTATTTIQLVHATGRILVVTIDRTFPTHVDSTLYMSRGTTSCCAYLTESLCLDLSHSFARD